MSTPHTQPELYVVLLRGKPVATVAAKTKGEVTAFLAEENRLVVRRVRGTVEAHHLAGVHQLPLEHAKEEYARVPLDMDQQQDLPLAEGRDLEPEHRPAHVQV